MTVTADMVKTLREKTGAGVLDCRKALAEVSGDLDKAVDYLRKKGLASAAKKSGRVTAEGMVTSYIHAGGKIGVLIEVNCETDFVAKTELFQNFVHDMAMHVAAANPTYVRREEVPPAVIEAERQIYKSQAQETKKPEAVIEKIVSGKVDKYFADVCMLEQPFIKDPNRTVQTVLQELIAKLGENLSIRRFTRFQLGEGIEKRNENLAEAVAKELHS
ncbi:MAG TPA: translation elongation factor Ts [Bdellovibrionota bacterium]|nr:translation elongation factor Ts [Bdellovibrionota bacterium]